MKRYQSGAEKKKKKQEKLMKLDLEIKKTQSLYQLGFTRKLADEDKIEAQSNASSEVIAEHKTEHE